jgi:hypothetical protein
MYRILFSSNSAYFEGIIYIYLQIDLSKKRFFFNWYNKYVVLFIRFFLKNIFRNFQLWNENEIFEFIKKMDNKLFIFDFFYILINIFFEIYFSDDKFDLKDLIYEYIYYMFQKIIIIILEKINRKIFL